MTYKRRWLWWAIVCGGIIMGVALSCTAFATIYGAISRIVDSKQRSWALGVADAVGGLALIALGNIVGTYLWGYLGDLYRRKYLLSGLYLARSGAMALFVLLP